MKLLVVIFLSVVSINASAESWELWASKDKSKGLRFLSSKYFTVNVESGVVSIKSPFRNAQECNSSYTKEYGVVSFNGTDIRLGFTCNKYNSLSHRIETEKGMAFVYDFLLNNKSFKMKFSSPTRSYAEQTFTFSQSGAELVTTPFRSKNITQNTSGAWYVTQEQSETLVLVEDAKKGSRGLLQMSFNEGAGEFTIKADLSTVDWKGSSGYQESYRQCDYLKYASKEGIIIINGHALAVPFECNYVNIQTSFTGRNGEDIYVVPATGYLGSQEVKIPITQVPEFLTAKTLTLSLDVEGVPVGEVKTITLKNSAQEMLLAIVKEAERQIDNNNKAMRDIRNKAGQAL
jgi:hypothetical protein